MDQADVPLTAFHARPGETVDRSQHGPVRLTKRNRTYAVVVSADWFRRAEEALSDRHGGRRVLDAETLSDEDRRFILGNGPAPEEIESDDWRN